MADIQSEKISRALKLLSKEARELYLADRVTTVENSISPLRFCRDHVSRNLPLLIKNGISHWKATKKWSIPYFRQTMPEKLISVAVTPNGYADAVASDTIGNEYFVEPEEREISVTNFLDELENPRENEIFYIQRQNSNFADDYPELWRDTEKELPWATESFGKDPDAVNFWMGDQRAVTSMHKDPYENIYCVISGEKQFILHPPTDLPWIPYRKYPTAMYKKSKNNDWIVEPTVTENSSQFIDVDVHQDKSNKSHFIPWISVDPLKPDYERYPAYKNTTTLTVKVEAGDVLYLPSLWFHHVRQSHGCIAINYWYDMEYDIKYAYYLALENLCSDNTENTK